MNSLADLSHEEFKQKFGLGYNRYRRTNLGARPTAVRYANISEEQMPREVDWRKLHAVAEVKNQLQVCARCRTWRLHAPASASRAALL